MLQIHEFMKQLMNGLNSEANGYNSILRKQI